ncbi:MAG: sulfatase [Verrucomicrobiota bacterium]|nr:sulfatase [Verrucomicrobiota bacterium]
MNSFKLLLAAGLALGQTLSAWAQQRAPVKRPNILMIIADDMNWDSPGCIGGAAPEIKPNIDSLAAAGMRFEHAYMNIAVCTPSRSVMLTGLYPHNNGAEGFQRIRPGTPTLPAILSEEGYFCGTVGKPLRQQDVFHWSVVSRWQGTGDEKKWGRDPGQYRRLARSFFQMAAESQQPFFLMASSHDPHRPYSCGASRERHFERAASSRTYRPDEVKVPGFLPDIRKEMAGYCTSTRLLVYMVGVVLEELAEAGRVDDMIVVFLSDHGMSAPFAKISCYVESTRTPLIVRWSGKVAAKQVDRRHMISTVDLLPTLLEAVGLPSPDRQDGRSFLPLLKGETQSGRDAVFAQFHHIHGRKPYPMRSVSTRDHVYVFNAWVKGKRIYSAEPMAGLTYRAMKRAGEKDVRLAKREHLLEYRTVEEFYDLNSDPFCLKNLTNVRPAAMSVLQKQLRDLMVKYGDFALEAFNQRDSPATLEQFMKDYTERWGKEVEALKPYEEAKRYRF